MNENQLSRIIVEAAIEVHRTLGGPGLVKGVYEECLAWEIENRGPKVERQKEIEIIYKDTKLGHPLRLDLIVE
jgi:GxxExxY protein